MPILQVLELPQLELEYWYQYYKSEYEEEHPEEKDVKSVNDVMSFFGSGTVKHLKKGEKSKLSGRIKE